jgi:sirohydrochlorin ferrochelatase
MADRCEAASPNVSVATVEGGQSTTALEIHPSNLPPPGSRDRWTWLQRLRRCTSVPLESWLAAIETGQIEPEPDLMAALAPHLDRPAAGRLLAWWLATPQANPALLQQIGQWRDPSFAAQLRRAVEAAPPERVRWLLPLLGHQRAAVDFPLLRRWVLGAQPTACRRAALEALAVGLPSWPLARLRPLLRRLAADLDGRLAGSAVDLLARLPGARRDLALLDGPRLDPTVQARRLRRLAALPAQPLVLVVHGRSGGVIPAELERLRAELEARRGAPVALQGLTAAAPPDPGPLRAAAGGLPLTLMPLLLLPGGHVCSDLPDLAGAWRASGPVLRLPFLGAWPQWQQGLREEAVALAAAGGGRGAGHGPSRPLLLHHPLHSAAGARYLAHLERHCAVRALATPYSAADSQEQLALLRSPDQPAALPLVLATNRLTEALPPRCGPALLQRPRVRDGLLDLLVALP